MRQKNGENYVKIGSYQAVITILPVYIILDVLNTTPVKDAVMTPIIAAVINAKSVFQAVELDAIYQKYLNKIYSIIKMSYSDIESRMSYDSPPLINMKN